MEPRGVGERGVDYGIYYYTPLPLNLANKQQATSNNKHVSVPFGPLHLPKASGLTLI